MLNSTDFDSHATGAARIFTPILKYKAANVFRILNMIQNREGVRKNIYDDNRTAEQARRSIYRYPKPKTTHPERTKPPPNTFKRASRRMGMAMLYKAALSMDSEIKRRSKDGNGGPASGLVVDSIGSGGGLLDDSGQWHRKRIIEWANTSQGRSVRTNKDDKDWTVGANLASPTNVKQKNAKLNTHVHNFARVMGVTRPMCAYCHKRTEGAVACTRCSEHCGSLVFFCDPKTSGCAAAWHAERSISESCRDAPRAITLFKTQAGSSNKQGGQRNKRKSTGGAAPLAPATGTAAGSNKQGGQRNKRQSTGGASGKSQKRRRTA